ncbi:MAG: hypothetical protein ACI9OU_000766 [Candidatus Promineifilaceae bacterium]|jgi:hypothetical protein
MRLRYPFTTLSCLLLAATLQVHAAEPQHPFALTAEQWHALQNELRDLRERVSSLEEENQSLRDQKPAIIQEETAPATPALEPSNPFGQRVLLGGEGGLIYLDTGKNGATPNREFRVDEARLFLDVLLTQDIYLFTELLLAERERNDIALNTGELYVDIENILPEINDALTLNLRAGRFDIPFGEEYLRRDANQNPLISHSLPDFWGIDEGLELFGMLGSVDYTVALQNGSTKTTRDGDPAKALTVRLGMHPTSWMRASVSAMRTGDLSTSKDRLSELWFGDAFIRSIGGTNTTTHFDAKLLQGDLSFDWSSGSLWLSGGVMDYADDDSASRNERDVAFYVAEIVQDLTPKVYSALRYSGIEASKGIPVVGQGDFGSFFSPLLTENIWRLGLGAGYRFSDHVTTKAEYSVERGELTNGKKLEARDQIGVGVSYDF